MSEALAAIRSAIWHPRMGYTDGCAMARTNERNVRTQRTHATKTRANNLLFLTTRVGLWTTRISRQGVTA